MLLVLLNFVLYVEVVLNVVAEISYGAVMCWSFVSVATKNRFCGNGVESCAAVGDVIISGGLWVEVLVVPSPAPSESLSFGWTVIIPVVSYVSVGFTNSSDCVLGRSLASGKLIFN